MSARRAMHGKKKAHTLNFWSGVEHQDHGVAAEGWSAGPLFVEKILDVNIDDISGEVGVGVGV